ncbi:MAG: hypothetical protein JOY99_00695 [Sphingomonadaceae bacterium]|nr:hypothetical protein [Sphingomonadaceae bacterium]
MTGSVETALSFGDEANGRIVLRGHDLARLAQSHGYEDVVAILWRVVVPADLTKEVLGAARARLFPRLASLEALAAGRSTADAMHLLLAALPIDGAVAAVAATGLAATLAMRSAGGLPWLAPDPALGHAADLLRLATGGAPDAATARALERYMILMIDHGVSASTFAVRIAASTGAGLAGCVAAGLAVLEGPLHGGAPSMVLDQLDEMQGVSDVPAYVAQLRARGKRVVGFGSRAYQGEDLRSALMHRQWEAIGGATGARFDAVATEAALADALAAAGKPLRANVEYYAALLLEACGIPRAGFTPMFAAARAAGWMAHVAEQRAAGRMIRPQTRYVGALPGC